MAPRTRCSSNTRKPSRSVLAPYSKSPRWESEGQRVVVGQRIIQGAPDIFLGWGVQTKQLGGSHFYIRQLRDMKGGIAFDPKNVKTLPEYCMLCGWALALAHAKSGDPAAIAGYLGKSDGMDEAVARFAVCLCQADRPRLRRPRQGRQGEADHRERHQGAMTQQPPNLATTNLARDRTGLARFRTQLAWTAPRLPGSGRH